MLEIRTTNGETLIHDDQQPDAMQITGYDGSRVMVHGGSWGNHKYIRKEGNRYIYPEDLKKVAKKVKNVYDDRHIYTDAANNMISDTKENIKKHKVANKYRELTSALSEHVKNQKEADKKEKKENAKKKIDSISNQINSAQGMTLKGRVIKKAAKKAREIYDERDIYADAAKNMASDYSKAAKDKWENGGKQAAKKAGKAILKSSKLGKLVDAGEDVISPDAGTRMRQGKKKKKEPVITFGGVSQVTSPRKEASESVERSMPGKKKRPKSRQKRVVDGGKEVKINDKRTTLKQIEKDKEFVKNSLKEGDKLPVGAKESDQVISAHQGSTGKNYWKHYGNNRKISEGAKSLNEQKEKTAARKKRKKQ